MTKTSYQYDVFISHAVEDKIAIANDLYDSLKEKGLKVWYSGLELSVGDKLIERIHEGLEQCRFGVVILSPTYLSKIWTLNEFFYLLKREKEEQKVILPVLYNITPQEIAMRFPLMADIFAVRAEKGLEVVTDVLLKEIKKQQEKESTLVFAGKANFSKKRIVISAFVAAICLVLGLGYFNLKPTPDHDFVAKAIENHIHDLQQKADLDLQQQHLNAITADEVKKLYTDFKNTKSYYRNEYTLNTGNDIIHSKKNVEAALSMDVESVSPLNLYMLSSPNIYHFNSYAGQTSREDRYIFYNTQAVTYRIEKSENIQKQYEIRVTYTNPIRLIDVGFTFPASSGDIKRYQISITALHPAETFSFTEEDDEWILKDIK